MDSTQIDTDLQAAMKARDTITVDTLRGLKSRIKNEEIAKGGPLDEPATLALFRSEVKRRKEAATSFEAGGRPELAKKELAELDILNHYLPAGPSDADMAAAVEVVVAGGNFTAKDFGPAMAQLKKQLPNADGGVLAKMLKEKLK